MLTDALCCGTKLLVVVFFKPLSEWRAGCNWELRAKMERGISLAVKSAGFRHTRQEIEVLSALFGWDPLIILISSERCTHQSSLEKSLSARSVGFGCGTDGRVVASQITFYQDVFMSVHHFHTNLNMSLFP